MGMQKSYVTNLSMMHLLNRMLNCSLAVGEDQCPMPNAPKILFSLLGRGGGRVENGGGGGEKGSKRRFGCV